MMHRSRDSNGTLSAVKDKTLIVAKSRPLLDAALRARGSGSRMTEANFVSSLNGLSHTKGTVLPPVGVPTSPRRGQQT